jgi:hypothetical protein
MVQVVSKEIHKSVSKEIVCNICGWTLSYTPLDVKEDYSTDYTGGKDYFNFIECPSCNNKVRVK